MLTNAVVCAMVPTTDLDRARSFYRDTLGLAEQSPDAESVYYEARGRRVLQVYQRPASPGETTVAVFLVDDLEKEMAELRGRGVSFVEYNEPELTTDNGLYSDSSGFKAAWINDPDGNTLGLEELPHGG